MSFGAVQRKLQTSLRETLGPDAVFRQQLAAAPFSVGPDAFDGFSHRYEVLLRYFATCEELVRRSFRDPDYDLIYRYLVGGLGTRWKRHHRDYHGAEIDPRSRFRRPAFFRTDEPVPGKIAEVQCPGSGLAFFGELERAWAANVSLRRFRPWDERVAEGLRRLHDEPVVFYIPKNSFPPDRLLFQASTARLGVRYADDATDPERVGILRTHTFFYPFQSDYTRRLVERAIQGRLVCDKPLSVMYESKVCMALPFHDRFSKHFDDEVRAMFPPTVIVEPGGSPGLLGAADSFERLCELPPSQRGYVLKFAGAHPGMNTGGKAVFSLRRTDKRKAREWMQRALSDAEKLRFWILQPDLSRRFSVALPKHGTRQLFARFSGFYGPRGLMTVRGQFRDMYKVNSSESTVVALVMP